MPRCPLIVAEWICTRHMELKVILRNAYSELEKLMPLEEKESNPDILLEVAKMIICRV